MPRSKKTVHDKLTEALEGANDILEDHELECIELEPITKPQLMERPSRPTDITIHTLEDYDYARKTYHHLLDRGNEAVNNVLALAEEAEHPRVFEVAAILIKSVSEVATALIVLQEKMKNLKGKDDAVLIQEKESGEKFVFAGNTGQLLEMINEAKKIKVASAT